MRICAKPVMRLLMGGSITGVPVSFPQTGCVMLYLSEVTVTMCPQIWGGGLGGGGGRLHY